MAHIWICLQCQGGRFRDSQARGNIVEPSQRGGAEGECPCNSLVKEIEVWRAFFFFVDRLSIVLRTE